MMKNMVVLAVLFLSLWAWAAAACLRERRWLEAAGWGLCGVIGAVMFAGRADNLPIWGKALLAFAFVAVSLTLSVRRLKRHQHGH
jgi:hypothetical protein